MALLQQKHTAVALTHPRAAGLCWQHNPAAHACEANLSLTACIAAAMSTYAHAAPSTENSDDQGNDSICHARQAGAPAVQILGSVRGVVT